MTKFNCPEKVTCVSADQPISNYSSERVDPVMFLGSGFIPSGPGKGGPGPYLGDTWYALGCIGWCSSTVSQEQADLCAQSQAEICNKKGDPNDPVDPNPPDPVHPNPPKPGDDGGDSGGSPDYNPPNNPDNPHDLVPNEAQTCTVECGNGSKMTFTIPAASVLRSTVALANAAAMSIACTKAQQTLFCMKTIPGYVCVGQPVIYFNDYVAIANGPGSPFVMSVISGTIPPGTEFFQDNLNTGILIGTPTTPGYYQFVVQAVSALGGVSSIAAQVDCFGLPSSVLDLGIVGSPYSFTLAPDGGVPPYGSELASGTLPPGLSLDSQLHITGIPTNPGTYTFQVRLSDSFPNQSLVCVQNCQINIVAPTICPMASLVWGSFYNTCTPAIPPSGTFSGGTFSFAGTGGFNACDDPAGPSGALCDGTTTYNGPNLICNLNFSNIFSGTANAFVEVIQNGISIFAAGIGVGFGNLPSGTYDFSFMLNDTGGSPQSLVVTVGWLAGAFLGSGGSLAGNGTLTCGCPAYNADVTPPVPATNDVAPQPGQIRITSYDPTLFGPCLGCPAAAFPNWDGTLPVQFNPNNAVLQYNPVGTDIGMGVFPQFNVQGRGTANNSTGIACVFVGGLYWELYIKCADGTAIWEGTKFYGDTPVGVYVRRPIITQYSTGPQCLSIETY